MNFRRILSLNNISRVCLLLFTVFLFSQIAYATTIIGIVYDNQRNPLPDVDVELQGNVGAFRQHTRTDSNGRYEFGGLGEGYFTVRVLPFRYDLEEQSQQIYVQTLSITGGTTNDTLIQDFYLLPRKGSLVEAETSVVFAQDIPESAKKAYEKALKDLSKKQTEIGISGLQEAVKIFPNYFLALQKLGSVYFFKGEYNQATQYLIKAADVNSKSPVSFFYLGYSLHKLGYNKAALLALKQAQVLSPSSAAVLYTLGMVERIEKDFVNAEKHLILAKKLSKTPSPDLHFQLAKLYGEDLKRYSEAADELEEFLKARPDAKDADSIKAMIKKLKEKAKSDIVSKQ